jgi:hypothetical protein
VGEELKNKIDIHIDGSEESDDSQGGMIEVPMAIKLAGDHITGFG